jgi:uncharacterized protein DUF6680
MTVAELIEVLRNMPMTTGDWVNVIAVALATLLSPLIALQVSRRLDERKERRGRRMWIFRTLMATRAERVTAAHVNALNSIDIEFKGERRVVEAWKAYHDHLGDRDMNRETWGTRSEDLFIDLLHELGESLKYHFDKVHLRRGIYTPEAHGRNAEDAEIIREALVAIAKGERGLKVDLSDVADGPEEEAAAEATKVAMREVFTGQRPMRVVIENTDGGGAAGTVGQGRNVG